MWTEGEGTQGPTENFNPHRCQLGSNDDFLIRNDHCSQKMPFIPFEVVEVGNVDTYVNFYIKKRKKA